MDEVETVSPKRGKRSPRSGTNTYHSSPNGSSPRSQGIRAVGTREMHWQNIRSGYVLLKNKFACSCNESSICGWWQATNILLATFVTAIMIK